MRKLITVLTIATCFATAGNSYAHDVEEDNKKPSIIEWGDGLKHLGGEKMAAGRVKLILRQKGINCGKVSSIIAAGGVASWDVPRVTVACTGVYNPILKKEVGEGVWALRYKKPGMWVIDDR